MNAVDALIMTSFTEGSPMVIKEAMCCNCPIVSVDVGDVKEVIDNTEVCYITDYNTNQLAQAVDKILDLNQRSNGRKKVEPYALKLIANKVLKIYNKLIGGSQ